jgi:putative endonuclease
MLFSPYYFGEPLFYMDWKPILDKSDCVYIMTNKINTVLYTGFSSDLPGRVMNHKNKVVKGFTKRYNVNKLVYYETCECREGALFREKQIKAGSR